MTIYRTPLGTFTTWEEAAAAVERADMDPCTCIEIVRPQFQDISHENGVRSSVTVRVF